MNTSLCWTISNVDGEVDLEVDEHQRWRGMGLERRMMPVYAKAEAARNRCSVGQRDRLFCDDSPL
jgi:hypothetical protein